MPATSVRCSVPTSIDSFISLRDLGTFSAVEHLGDAQIDLQEVVDGDAIVDRPPRAWRAAGGGCGARVAAAAAGLTSSVTIAPSVCST